MSYLNWFENWVLSNILAKCVRQGGHEDRIRELYTLISATAKREFYEDNAPTLNGFLTEIFTSSLPFKD